MVDFTRQPLKGVYAICAIGFEISRFPVYLVTFLLGFGRQNPKWTFRQAISTRVFSSVLWHIAKLQVGTPLPLTPGAEKERFILVKPANSDAYKGPLRSNKDVVPVEIGATWYPAPLTAGSDKSRTKVILHTHGGAFVHGDGRTQASGFMAKLLLKHSPATHILCPQYRLSTLPASPTSNPFPAAPQDVLTSYLYLLNDLKIPPKNIIVSGDSAGGNLTIALLRYITEYGAELDLPNPSAALLWSPWVDPSDTSCSYVHDNRNYKTDYLSPPFTKWGTSAYAGLAGEKVLSSPYVSPKYSMFRTPVPMWVSIGGSELLFFDVVEWAGKMREEGNEIVLDSEENVPHDILLLGGILGFKEQAHNIAKMAGEWLEGE